MPRKTKSMLEKLAEDHKQTIAWGNGGHMVGYYSEQRKEIVMGRYEFEKGVYVIELVCGKFFWWHYDVKE